LLSGRTIEDSFTDAILSIVAAPGANGFAAAGDGATWALGVMVVVVMVVSLRWVALSAQIGNGGTGFGGNL
jgi:hypothetical protein